MGTWPHQVSVTGWANFWTGGATMIFSIWAGDVADKWSVLVTQLIGLKKTSWDI